MTPIEIGSITFGCVFGGALLGMTLGGLLPQHHLSAESKDVVKLGMGLIATIAALVLGLLIASAKSTFEAKSNELKQISANILLLDRVLAQYGPETAETRGLLRRSVETRLDATWPTDSSRPPRIDLPETTPMIEGVQARIRELAPSNDSQRWLKSRALNVSGDIAQLRWLLFGSAGMSIPTPFLVILIFWVTMIFASFGLFAPRNATVVGVMLVCALSIAGSLFLILDMDRPFAGWTTIPSAPLRYTLSQLGQ